MRILYHHRTRAEDGQAVHIRALQRAFREEGHELREVALVERSEAGGPEAQGARAGGDSRGGAGGWGWVAHLPRFALELAEYAYSVPARGKLVRAAREFEPDFLYERYAFGNLAGVQAARRLGLPLVLEVNSPMVLELGRTRGLALPGLARRVEKFIFRGADRVAVVTRVLGDMLEELGVEHERIVVTPNGVHPELYADPDPAAARSALGLPPTGLVLGFTGYYRAWHRLDLVLPALREPALADAHLVLVGEGPAREELEQAATRIGVRDRVHFAGRRRHDEIPALLAAFDLALVPAINPYASPLKLHEYMAAGLAVVAPDQPNLREVLVHGETALLVAPGDGDALASALLELAGDAALRGRLGAAAAAAVIEQELTWRGNARRVIAAVGG